MKTFDSIDSVEKAYWLGFIMADGNISGTSLRLELSTKDFDHLYKWQFFMESEHPIVLTRKNCCIICINSRYIVDSLEKYGMVKNKTYNVTTPNLQPQYLSHFYRGIFDGDGWITQRYSKDRSPCYEIGFCSANETFLLEIKDYFNTVLNNSKGYIINRRRPTCGVFELHFGGNKQFIEIGDILYSNSEEGIRLSRKYEKYTFASNSKRKA